MPESLRLQDTTGQSDDINLKEIPTEFQIKKTSILQWTNSLEQHMTVLLSLSWLMVQQRKHIY